MSRHFDYHPEAILIKIAYQKEKGRQTSKARPVQERT
jgi:hypothetical protein